MINQADPPDDQIRAVYKHCLVSLLVYLLMHFLWRKNYSTYLCQEQIFCSEEWGGDRTTYCKIIGLIRCGVVWAVFQKGASEPKTGVFLVVKPKETNKWKQSANTNLPAWIWFVLRCSKNEPERKNLPKQEVSVFGRLCTHCSAQRTVPRFSIIRRHCTRPELTLH